MVRGNRTTGESPIEVIKCPLSMRAKHEEDVSATLQGLWKGTNDHEA